MLDLLLDNQTDHNDEVDNGCDLVEDLCEGCPYTEKHWVPVNPWFP